MSADIPMRSPADPLPPSSPGELSQAKVFTLVFVGALIVLLAGPYGNVSSTGTLDPWIYTGYFLNFRDLVVRFGHTYYLSRAPYLYPGVALYSIFTPQVANLVLNALLWTGIAAPLFLVTRRFFGRVAASIIVVATFANPYLGMSIGWDYPDAPAISFVALGLWLALAPPRRWPATLALALAGACWMMAALTNMIAVLIAIAAAATVAIWRYENFKRALLEALAIGAGALACFAAWSCASRLAIGQWNILAPQLAQIAYAKAHPDYLQDMWGRGYDWVATSYRLLAPPAVLLASGVLLLRWRKLTAIEQRALLGSLGGLLVALGLFAWYEFGAHKVLLRVSYHSTYLALPTLFSLAIAGGIALRPPLRWPVAQFLAVIACGLIPLVWRGCLHHPINTLPWLVGFGAAVAALAGLAWRPTAMLGVAACFFAISFSLTRDDTVASFGFRPKEAVMLPDSTGAIVSGGAAYQLELAADLIVLIKNAGGRDQTLRFWYDGNEPGSNLFHSLYSLYLWGYRDLTTEVPVMSPEDLRNFLTPRGRILHLTGDPERIKTRRQLLEKRGIAWKEIGSWNLGRRGERYRIVIDEIQIPP